MNKRLLELYLVNIIAYVLSRRNSIRFILSKLCSKDLDVCLVTNTKICFLMLKKKALPVEQFYLKTSYPHFFSYRKQQFNI